jgi:hypothetical protein
MTFRTWQGLTGSGVTFESVQYPGYYIVSKSGKLSLSDNPDAKEATFYVEEETSQDSSTTELQALKTKRVYAVGEGMRVDDIQVSLIKESGEPEILANGTYTVGFSKVNTSKAGTYPLTITYVDGKKNVYTADITITVVDKAYFN